MGKYVKQQRRPRSIEQALQEAEADHLLDCPKATMASRLAAFTLDIMFLALAINGIDGLSQTVYLQLSQTDAALQAVGSPAFWANYLNLSLRAIFLMGYSVLTVSFSGGTPGKLLLGLRTIDYKTGEYLSVGQSLLRLICLVLLLPLAPIVFTKDDSVAYHDLIAGSSVRRVRGKI